MSIHTDALLLSDLQRVSGLTADGVMTIRRIMRNHGYRWSTPERESAITVVGNALRAHAKPEEGSFLSDNLITIQTNNEDHIERDDDEPEQDDAQEEGADRLLLEHERPSEGQQALIAIMDTLARQNERFDDIERKVDYLFRRFFGAKPAWWVDVEQEKT